MNNVSIRVLGKLQTFWFANTRHKLLSIAHRDQRLLQGHQSISTLKLPRRSYMSDFGDNVYKQIIRYLQITLWNKNCR